VDGVRLTHVGGPTVLIEVAGWRLLTDPTFDPPGRRWSFGWGSSSRKLTGPAVAAADLGPVDAVLLTHDQHADNLDEAGRSLLASVSTVVTTGPVKYTMTARDAVELCHDLHPRTVVPVHYEGWSHFSEGRHAAEREFARAPDDVRRAIRWLPLGEAVEAAT
jgi:L-ascorbate metabolism protein UlaG (beta-lactamase superfamily)